MGSGHPEPFVEFILESFASLKDKFHEGLKESNGQPYAALWDKLREASQSRDSSPSAQHDNSL